MFLVPSLIMAQPKPTRDKSKDINFSSRKIDSKVNSIKQRALTKNKARQVKHRRKVMQSVTPDPYLYVNGNTISTNKHVGFDSQYIYFTVSSNKQVVATMLPSWCRFSGYNGHMMYIHVDKNLSENSRSGYFMIRAGNKEVKVNITQSGHPFMGTAVANSVSVSHNIKYGREKYMVIYANVTINNAKGKKCHAIALVRNGTEYIKAKPYAAVYNKFGADQLVGASSSTIYPEYNSSTLDIIMYLPNSAMELQNKNNSLILEIYVYCDGYSVPLLRDPYYIPFKAKKKRKGIITRSN
jgi:hypothetical protein